MSEPRLVTGAVLYAPPRLLPEPRRCDRCGLSRPGWAWWSTMHRPDGERALGEACADCHTLPGDTPSRGVDSGEL